MCSAALLPVAVIIGAYVVLVLCISVVQPQWMPATPGPVSGASADRPSRGYRSLAWLALGSTVGSWVFMQQYPALLRRMGRDIAPPPPDERVISGLAVATPTEGGALVAVEAWLFATLRRCLTLQGFFDALLQTVKLSCFVRFILIGSTIFSHTFNAVDGGVCGWPSCSPM